MDRFRCSVLRFPIENSSNTNLENNEINEKNLKKAMEGISQEIWGSNQESETGRFNEKLGAS